jgi:hypothetical protein
LNFIEKNIEGIESETVDAYSLTLGKLFKWLQLAIKTRKDDITRRKAQRKKAIGERDNLIESAQQRGLKYDADVAEAEEKFKDEHRDEIEAVVKFEQMEKEKENDDYGEEEEDEEKEKVLKEKPVMPEFNLQEYIDHWEEENPKIAVLDLEEADKDMDWDLTEEDEEALIDGYFKSKAEA